MGTIKSYTELTSQEAASLVKNNDTVGFSGFTAAGAAKVVPLAIARMAADLHANGKEFKINVISGASTGESLDTALANADAIDNRYGYQSSKVLRGKINSEKAHFLDIHLSHMASYTSDGAFGKIDLAVIEASDVTEDGKVYLTTGIGISPTLLSCASKVIIELNTFHSPRIREMLDIYCLTYPAYTWPANFNHPMKKIGKPHVQIDPKKIIGIVKNHAQDEIKSFGESDQLSEKIADNVAEFLISEITRRNMSDNFLPVQSGVGNIGNAVMHRLGDNKRIPPFYMYTEVFQDSLVELMRKGRLLGISTCALTIEPKHLQEIYDDMDFFGPKIVLRPQEISNNIVASAQLGAIAINTALEVDIYGNVNSTHVCGTQIMNGIGGSADFSRGAYLSLFMCPSFAKGGKISSVVPMCSHIDSSEHSVQVIITEQGVADLRGKTPEKRAKVIIDNCAHPAYKDYLQTYINSSKPGHLRHNFEKVFELHLTLMKTGTMLPGIKI
jgi:succinate CoA transferase